MTDEEIYFYSLTRPTIKRDKRRKCLKCGAFFKSNGPGNRTCGNCSRANQNYGTYGTYCI
jgi:hypothetical protein